jgi:competence protein ComEC
MGPEVFTSVINSYLPEPHASLLNGILFGLSLKTADLFYNQLKMVGLLHIVVLSGMNITILAAITASVTGFLDKRVSILITMLTIIGFILFVGPKAPIVRAGIMGILALLAISYGRRSLAMYSLLVSFLIVATIWPGWISTLSLQLSYMATLGIILFGGSEFRTSIAAQAFTAPLIFFHFQQISFIAPLSNLFVAVSIPPLMIFGLLTATLGKINYFLGLIPSYICYAITSYIIFIVESLSKVPLAFWQMR